MTMASIGVDIEEISRFSKRGYDTRKEFYDKIFTPDEIKYCLSKADPYPHFAVRFCAKEAAVKALNEKIFLKNVEIKMIRQKPIIRLPGKKKGLVSLSHTKNYAVAFVMIC